MDRLFAPWRIKYIEMPKTGGCIFCELPGQNRDEENLILARLGKAFAIMNNFPYNPGHVMVAPFRHVGKPQELTEEEVLDMHRLVSTVMRAVEASLSPHGFNLGVNVGEVAGAGVLGHIHVHIVPRWLGDTNFMPVLADTKVVPEAVRETYYKIKKELDRLLP